MVEKPQRGVTGFSDGAEADIKGHCVFSVWSLLIWILFHVFPVIIKAELLNAEEFYLVPEVLTQQSTDLV